MGVGAPSWLRRVSMQLRRSEKEIVTGTANESAIIVCLPKVVDASTMRVSVLLTFYNSFTLAALSIRNALTYTIRQVERSENEVRPSPSAPKQIFQSLIRYEGLDFIPPVLPDAK